MTLVKRHRARFHRDPYDRRLAEETKKILLERTPLARFVALENIASAVGFLVGPDAGFIAGHVLMVDGELFMP